MLGLGWRSTISSTWAAGMCGWTRSISIPIDPASASQSQQVHSFAASPPMSPLSLCVTAGLDTSTITSFATSVALDYEETLTATATGRRSAATQLTLAP